MYKMGFMLIYLKIKQKLSVCLIVLFSSFVVCRIHTTILLTATTKGLLNKILKIFYHGFFFVDFCSPTLILKKAIKTCNTKIKGKKIVVFSLPKTT